MVYIHIWYTSVLARGSEFGGKRRSDRAYLRLMVAYVCYVEFGLFLLVSHHDDARPRERSDPRFVFCLQDKKVSSYRGAYRVPLCN